MHADIATLRHLGERDLGRALPADHDHLVPHLRVGDPGEVDARVLERRRGHDGGGAAPHEDAIGVDASEQNASFLLAPDALAPWPPRALADIDEAAIEAVLALKPEVILLGTGARQAMAPPRVMAAFLSRGVGLEAMTNAAAGRTFRLLFRLSTADPRELRRFADDVIGPVARHDQRHATELLVTLRAYLDHNCNMNLTARTTYTHRHTVSNRLTRIRELTGLDPLESEDRELLGLALKAHRVVELRPAA